MLVENVTMNEPRASRSSGNESLILKERIWLVGTRNSVSETRLSIVRLKAVSHYPSQQARESMDPALKYSSMVLYQ